MSRAAAGELAGCTNPGMSQRCWKILIPLDTSHLSLRLVRAEIKCFDLYIDYSKSNH